MGCVKRYSSVESIRFWVFALLGFPSMWNLLGEPAKGTPFVQDKEPGVGSVSAARDQISFQSPFRIRAEDVVIDTGDSGGHSSPCVVDINHDGLDDLILGSFGGRFQVYRNVGSQAAPKYTPSGYLKAGDTDAKVYIYCCIGGQPRFADFDGDRVLDLIANSYDPGHCHLFRGLPGGEFAESVEVVDQKGNPVRSSHSVEYPWKSFGSFFEPTDWDDDGDLDLLIGDFDGALKLRINQGDSTAAKFAEVNQAVWSVSGPIHVKGHCCPVVGDMDGDGLWDIVVGSEDGSVTYFRNRGMPGTPEFEDGLTLVKPSPDLGYERISWSDEDIYPGIRSQVDLADMNGDGRLDLLVGDFYTAYKFRNDLSAEEKQKVSNLVASRRVQQNTFYKELSLLGAEIDKRYPGERVNSPEAKAERARAEREYFETEAGQQYQASEEQFYAALRPFIATNQTSPDAFHEFSKSHGHVWVYIQKTAISHASKAPTPQDPVGLRLAINPADGRHDEFELSLQVEVLEPYEIQAFQASPPKKPTQIELKLPSGLEPLNDWQFPKPKRSNIPGTLKSYWGTIEFTRVIKVAAGASVPSDNWIECSVLYQACDAARCLRETKSVVKVAVP